MPDMEGYAPRGVQRKNSNRTLTCVDLHGRVFDELRPES